jgi:hypothetical protein
MDLSLQHHGADLREISKKLRRMDNPEIKKRFRRELRKAAAPLVPAVRAAIADIPTTGDRHTGLRKRLQKATRLKVKTTGREAGVSILVDPKKMPDHEKSLPQAMEGLKRWRHPVFGHDVWVTQEPSPYFFRTVRPLGVSSRVAVNRVVDGITREIT